MKQDQVNSQPIQISLSWSGGKDSAFALWKLQQDSRYRVVRLHTTFGEETRRVGLHGIHEKLIEQQAEAIGLPLDKIYYPASGDNQAYEKAMNFYLDELETADIQHIGYGDIFLEDLRKYREDQLASRNFNAVFPLWKMDTTLLAAKFIESGFQTIICAADADKIGEDWIGKIFVHEFLKNLPVNVDPCGENGEFHTFCFDGPIYKMPIPFGKGKVVSKSYKFKKEDGIAAEKKYWFQEVLVCDFYPSEIATSS